MEVTVNEMISFERAKQIAIEKIGPECALMEDRTLAKPYGWYFMYQSKEYLRTGKLKNALFGSGGFIVERQDGHIYEFGSAYPLERNLAAYAYGLRHKVNDLIVHRIYSFERTLDLLLTVKLQYVVPEFAHGRQWRIPRAYDRTQLAKMLRSLPCTFADCRGFYFMYENFLEIDQARCCEYEIRGHRDGRP